MLNVVDIAFPEGTLYAIRMVKPVAVNVFEG